jgi:hypothetical protein
MAQKLYELIAVSINGNCYRQGSDAEKPTAESPSTRRRVLVDLPCLARTVLTLVSARCV